MSTLRGTVVIGALLLAGCSSGGESKRPVVIGGPDVSVCVDALDAADAGFRGFADALRTIKTAFDQAADGDPAQGTRTLQRVDLPSSAHYKQLEQLCRAAAR